jgi:hypothetical protein
MDSDEVDGLISQPCENVSDDKTSRQYLELQEAASVLTFKWVAHALPLVAVML